MNKTPDSPNGNVTVIFRYDDLDLSGPPASAREQFAAVVYRPRAAHSRRTALLGAVDGAPVVGACGALRRIATCWGPP